MESPQIAEIRRKLIARFSDKNLQELPVGGVDPASQETVAPESPKPPDQAVAPVAESPAT